MKIKLLSIFLIGLFVTSCIKDEPQFREADIEGILLPDSIMANYIISGENVTIIIHPDANYKKLAPQIKLSEGATVSPASGDTIDFTKDTIYVVTSQDGKAQRKYKISVTSNMSLKFNFDEWVIASTVGTPRYLKYDNNFWANANQGASMILDVKNDPTLYPIRSTDDAISGKACLMETIEGKQLKVGNKYYDIPVVSGSCFMGKFTLSTGNPLASTKFGQIHLKQNGKPTKFTGHYKYKAGEKFVLSDYSIDPNKIDEGDVYAVIYKVKKGNAGINEFLTGVNIQTSDSIVAKAKIDRVVNTSNFDSSFIKFEVPFLNSKTNQPDYELDFENHAYKIGIIMSPSKRGDYYEGAPGSTLIVDDLEIVSTLIKD